MSTFDPILYDLRIFCYNIYIRFEHVTTTIRVVYNNDKLCALFSTCFEFCCFNKKAIFIIVTFEFIISFFFIVRRFWATRVSVICPALTPSPSTHTEKLSRSTIGFSMVSLQYSGNRAHFIAVKHVLIYLYIIEPNFTRSSLKPRLNWISIHRTAVEPMLKPSSEHHFFCVCISAHVKPILEL